MKKTNYSTVVALGTVLLIAAGCGNNSSNPSVSTNAVSGAVPSTNEIVVNTPPTSMTNAPTSTNSITETNK
jgi:hypothetical protein